MKTYWETAAETRWGKYITEIECNMILEGLELAGNPGKVLEVGCDGGRWLKILSDKGWEVICTDVNQESLNILKQKIPYALCIKVEPTETKLPVNNNHVNFLLCIEVAPVINENWFIDEAYRVLTNNSITVLMCWNKLSARGLFYLIKELIGFKGRHSEDYYKRSYTEWKSKFILKGFTIIKEVGFCWFPFSRESNSPLIPFFTKIEKILGLRKIIRFSPWVVLIARKN